MWNNHVVEILCRNLGKTTITALALATRCILYPSTQVLIVASSRRQAVESILKIKQFCNDSPMLRAEISLLSDSVNNPKIYFFNGSTINIITGNSDTSRGQRAHIVVVDEFAASELDHDFVQSVLIPMTGDYRRYKALTLPEYMKPEYEYLKEEPKEIYLSSAGHRSSWTYNTFMDFTKKCYAGEEGFFTCSIPYMTAIECGLRSKKFYLDQMLKDNYNKSKGDAEYLSIWQKDSDNCFFTFESLDNCRNLRKAIYTNDLNELIMSKNKKYLNPKKPSGAIRILGADLAFVKRRDKNDASAFIIMQLIPNTKTITVTESNGERSKVKTQYYERQVIYIETQQGMLIEKQAERLKQLYFEFDCDKMIIDAKNAGISVIQELAKPTVDSKTGSDYPPFKCYNDETYSEICSYDSALKTLYCMNATADSNKLFADGLQRSIGNKTLQLLIDQNIAKDQLGVISDYDSLPMSTQMKLEQPYFETRLLIEEMSALELVSSTPFRLREPSSGRKDRYSALLYCSGLADQLEAELNKTKKKRSGFTCKYTPQEYFDRS